MLPTLPDLERRRERMNLDRIHEISRGLSPFAREIKAHIQHEGSGAALARAGGETEKLPMREVGASLVVRDRALKDYDSRALERMLKDAATQIARGLTEMFRRTMDEVTEKTGNVVDAAGAAMTEDLFLDAIETMDHAFDRAGNWKPPTVIGGREAIEGLLAAGESAAGHRRLKRILEVKRDEFRRREAARVLVG